MHADIQHRSFPGAVATCPDGSETPAETPAALAFPRHAEVSVRSPLRQGEREREVDRHHRAEHKREPRTVSRRECSAGGAEDGELGEQPRGVVRPHGCLRAATVAISVIVLRRASMHVIHRFLRRPLGLGWVCSRGAPGALSFGSRACSVPRSRAASWSPNARFSAVSVGKTASQIIRASWCLLGEQRCSSSFSPIFRPRLPWRSWWTRPPGRARC